MEIFVGIFMAVGFVYYDESRIRKEKKALEELNIEQYQCTSFFNKIFHWLIALLIFTAFCIYIGFKESNTILISISIALFISGLSLTRYAYHSMRLYHNDSRCIIEGKAVQYKNIKSIRKKSFLPFSKGEVILYSGEKKYVYHPAIEIINQYLNNK
ncbi:MAG: hypothetical protein GX914_01150 [Erysipelotrichia bacterium]|nr:hypothetical protein [Erysipelotrichia bacterium]